MTPIVVWLLAVWVVASFAAMGLWTVLCALARRRQSRSHADTGRAIDADSPQVGPIHPG